MIKNTSDIKILKQENVRLKKELKLVARSLNESAALIALQKEVESLWSKNNSDID